MEILWWAVPAALLLASVAALTALVIRKIPDLRVIDVESLPEERQRRMKERLILDRISRIRAKRTGKVAKAAGSAVKGASKAGRRAVQRLYALEQYYQKLKQAESNGEHALADDAVKRLIGQAEELVREEEFIPAEKKYIEIISHHPKNIDAYEGLGNLYLKAKQVAQARETLLFALRLSPQNASILMSLAEIETAEGDHAATTGYLRQAVEKRPGNPKYLDAYIEAAIAAKLPEDAEKGLKLLKESNPENQKIGSFEEQIKGLQAA